MLFFFRFDRVEFNINGLIKIIFHNTIISKTKRATDNVAKKMEVVPPYYIQPSYPVHSTLGILKLEDIESETSAFMALHQRLEEELRAAKRAQLSCGEVLLPPDLLRRIARDVLKMAENEPCGLRGCTLYLNFEGDHECRKIGTIKCDTNTVSTFELFLTLKQDTRNIWSLIPLFIRNLAKGGTVVIDQEFTIEKRKLYRSFLE